MAVIKSSFPGQIALAVLVYSSVCVLAKSVAVDSYRTSDLMSIHPAERAKRTVQLAVKGGVAALKKLLSSAEEVSSYSNNFRKYEKQGDANTAINDYYSIRPNDRRIMHIGIQQKSKPGTVLTGLVDDKRVVLLIDGDIWSKGRPVLEIINTKSQTLPNTERIVYTKP